MHHSVFKLSCGLITEIEDLNMDATHIFFSRPSHLSSFKVYHANDLHKPTARQYGGGRAPSSFERAMARFLLGVAATGISVIPAMVKKN